MSWKKIVFKKETLRLETFETIGLMIFRLVLNAVLKTLKKFNRNYIELEGKFVNFEQK